MTTRRATNAPCYDALKKENERLRELLREACDEGLIYWEPQTPRGAVNKALLLARIHAALEPRL